MRRNSLPGNLAVERQIMKPCSVETTATLRAAVVGYIPGPGARTNIGRVESANGSFISYIQRPETILACYGEQWRPADARN